MSTLQVQGSPSYYECELNILDSLENLIKRYGFSKGIVFHGEASWRVAKPFFPNFKDITLVFEQYKGECSESEILRLSKKHTGKDTEFIIGIGGGKVLDLAKAVANETKKDVILIPTLASTCAAWTPLSVIYNDHGEFITHKIFPRSNLMVLLEPRILLNSPLNYLKAGVADTLAKLYESMALTKHLSNPRIPIQLALKTAQLIEEVLLKDSEQAFADFEKGYLSEELLSVFETNIAAGGLVGGLGGDYGRIAAAHSVHNALTTFKETHHLLHGEKVAYGILVQLSLENKFDEVEKLIAFYLKLDLPYSLSLLGLDIKDQEMLYNLATATISPGESIHFIKGIFVEADIIAAILNLENFTKKLLTKGEEL